MARFQLYGSVPITQAKFAVIGTDLRQRINGHGSGVLGWFTNEVTAQGNLKGLQAHGVKCEVVPAPKGEMDKADAQKVESYIFDHLK